MLKQGGHILLTGLFRFLFLALASASVRSMSGMSPGTSTSPTWPPGRPGRRTGPKPFLLPQRDPEQNRRLFKSDNVPEFTVDAVRWSTKRLEDILLSTPVQVEQVSR